MQVDNSLLCSVRVDATKHERNSSIAATALPCPHAPHAHHAGVAAASGEIWHAEPAPALTAGHSWIQGDCMVMESARSSSVSCNNRQEVVGIWHNVWLVNSLLLLGPHGCTVSVILLSWAPTASRPVHHKNADSPALMP